MPMETMHDSMRECLCDFLFMSSKKPMLLINFLAVEDAIQILNQRDPVYYDANGKQWVCSMPTKARIRTRFGEVRVNIMMDEYLLSPIDQIYAATRYRWGGDLRSYGWDCLYSSMFPVLHERLHD